MLQLKKVTYNYPEQQSFKGIKNINLELKEAELLTIVGESGCGKTTLLKSIFGLFDLQQGEILFNNAKVTGPAYNLIPGHKEMNLVSQDYYVLDNHTVFENISDKLNFYTNAYKEKRSKELLKVVGLLKEKDKKANQLSNGQKQRLSIARALADFPKLLLLDEPFSNLDFARRDELFSFIRNNMEEHQSSCIMVTHHPEEALRYADKVALMQSGKITRIDTPEKMYYKPNDLEEAMLFGKCYELDKTDFIDRKSLKFIDNKILIRPEQLQLVSKRSTEKKLQGKIIQVLFALSYYEVQIELESGKIISCYSATKEFKKGEEGNH
jgi:iron(III) transport system ATP-binding protein